MPHFEISNSNYDLLITEHEQKPIILADIKQTDYHAFNNLKIMMVLVEYEDDIPPIDQWENLTADLIDDDSRHITRRRWLDLTPTSFDALYRTEYGISTHDIPQFEQLLTLTVHESTRILIFMNDENRYTMFNDLLTLRQRLDDGSAYYNVVTENGIENVLSIILKLDQPTRYIESLMLRTRYNAQAVYNRILEEYHAQLPDDLKRDLLSQEEQIQAFLDYSRDHDNIHELVKDDIIELLTNTCAYQQSIEKLKAHGFALSQTQQFNVLQSVGLFTTTDKKNLYNLSDMGSGKTLMTVQSLYVMDLLSLSMQASNTEDAIFQLPNRHVLAPQLSIKSSWLETFSLFYDIREITPTLYELTTTIGGKTGVTRLSLNGFRVVGNGMVVDQKVPDTAASGYEYLIVDEVHQLAKPYARSKFFENGTIPYYTWFLSGTLSNMPTREWYHFLKLFYMHAPLTPNEAKTRFTSLQNEMSSAVKEACYRIEDARRLLKTEPIGQKYVASAPKKSQTNHEAYFYAEYAPQYIIPRGNPKTHEDALSNFALKQNVELLDGPNFKLFYEQTEACAITANAEQVATELFGKVETQHDATIVRTQSSLSTHDLSLLKVIRRIIDEQSLTNKRIANALATSLLNLNDGMGGMSLYDTINHYAGTNQRFLDYLGSLPTAFLQELQASKMVQSVDLQHTEKFKVLKRLLEEHAHDKVLVVVNDKQAMATLGKALNIPVFKAKEMSAVEDYQQLFDQYFQEQSVVITPQAMVSSSLDLVQANVLVQYQLNIHIADMIQTQNRINRIGQTKETYAYYIATDQLQNELIQLFLQTYQHIKVAHKGIVELFTDVQNQVNVISDYLNSAFERLEESDEASNNPSTIRPLVTPDEWSQLTGELIDGAWHTNGLCITHDDKASIVVPNLDQQPVLVAQFENGGNSRMVSVVIHEHFVEVSD